MPLKKLHFHNSRNQKLSAVLDRPTDVQPVGYALLAHCFTCSKDLRGLRTLSRALTQQGFAVLRFDFTGLGSSEGDFPETNFSSSIQDVVDAANFLKTEFDAPSLLVGHSLGGAAVIRAAASIESAQAVATVGAPADPEHVRSNLEGDLELIEETGEGRVKIAGRSFTIQRQFLDDIAEQPMKQSLRNLGIPLMVFHGPLDNVVGIENASKIFLAAKHPKSFISLNDADHLLTQKEDATFAGNVLGAWAHRYVVERGTRDDEDPDSGSHITSMTPAGGLRTEIVANGHLLVADEPESVEGGSGSGPTPYDYLGVALASCTSMTLRMYADRKEWTLDDVSVGVHHSKIHAKDCADCEEKDQKLDRFKRTLTLEGELSDDQRKKLLSIANRCPVHLSLERKVEIETTLSNDK